jgi:NAD(P)-dependent dehydrogenase (short-subunit alcohol dehydrogenase family)
MNDYLKKFSLENKIACVTGGCGLIGREISRAFATAKAKTIILDIDEAKGNALAEELVKEGYDAHFVNFNITEMEKAEENIKSLIDKFGKIDVWVNNAYPRTRDWGNKVEDLKLESWRSNVDMHLNSYSWFSRCVAMAMKDGKIAGSIINFGSTYGVVGNDFTVYDGTSMTSPMGYAAIKGGIINLTRYLASYFGKYNIRVNNVCPGGIFDNQNPTFVNNYNHKVPLGRMGTPSDIASGVLFLASDAASYVTGATLMVDGGWTAI